MMETLRRLVVALSGNDQLALSQSAYIQRFRGPLPMLNARCGIRGRGLMSASSSRTAATATAMQMRQIPRDHHIMNPLCAANTGRRVSLSFLSSFSLDRCISLGALLSRVPPSLTVFIIPASTRCRSLVAPSAAKRHLMKCHRCPTDCRVKCRRLLIPRLFLQHFDFARRNAAGLRRGR